MKTAVVLLNFGEPPSPTLDAVVPFLERIFATNAALFGPGADAAAIRERSRELARRRAPGLIDEYREIGGSPLHRQAEEQAEALEAELHGRGLDALVLLGMQFTEPSIADAVTRAGREGAEQILALPVYPLAGPSTTVAALAEVDRAVADAELDLIVHRISGWHRHGSYVRMRASWIREVVEREGLSLHDSATRLVLSAHGTPMTYIEAGSRYDLYVRDFCDRLDAELGGPGYVLGYQNHGNRPGVRWTEPDIDRAVSGVDARRIVVDPISFMHEQSETLAELDHELREVAEARGLDFHRVPIRHRDPAFIALLADLAEPLVRDPSLTPADAPSAGGVAMTQCLCNPVPGTFCMNPTLTR